MGGVAKGILGVVERTDPIKPLNPLLAPIERAFGTPVQGQPPMSPTVTTIPGPVIPVPRSDSSSITVAGAPAPTVRALNGPRLDDGDAARRRAAAAGGAAGVTLPPVGVRGAGGLARTTILGR